MSNIAGKAYAMNLVTPLRAPLVPINKLIFWALRSPLLSFSLRGLLTLSLIHYARWVIVRGSDLPRLDKSQPKEELRYHYMFFFSNFNGSWEQYVDSFSAAIPSGLDLLWLWNVAWPKAVPEQPFHRYVEHNQIWTDYYYSAYPMAASNDVKCAHKVKQRLCEFAKQSEASSPQVFLEQYNRMLKDLQNDLGQLASSPIVSLAAEDIAARRRQSAAQANAAANPAATQLPSPAPNPAPSPMPTPIGNGGGGNNGRLPEELLDA
jgi:hypothetical protein